MDVPNTRCMRCDAPIPFQPGAGSRLCPFCGAINLVREQRIAALPLELEIDDIFRCYQTGQMEKGMLEAQRLIESVQDNFRLLLYRACLELGLGQTENAVFSLIDLGGLDAPIFLRADAQAKLAEALLEAGRIGESIQASERCLELQDAHPAGSLCLAKAYLEQGELQQSLQIVQEIIARFGNQWRTTFPPRRDELLILRAHIENSIGEYSRAATTLETLITTVTEATLDFLIQAAHHLGRNYLEHGLSISSALDVFKIAVLMDPENLHGLLDDLRDAADGAGVDQGVALDEFRQSRQELLSAIRAALDKSDANKTLEPSLITPELELGRIASDPDSRVDILDAAAQKILPEGFDRGTLYPLRTIEDFRRWAASWRLKAKTRTLANNRNELLRITKLKESMQKRMPGKSIGSYVKQNSTIVKTRKVGVARKFLWTVVLLILLSVAFIALAGRQFLDEFHGSIIKVECAGEKGTPPCTLHVSGGRDGQKRFARKKHPRGQLQGIWSWWMDDQVHPDGTIVYSLDLPWGHVDTGRLKNCPGKKIVKDRFSFSPRCLKEK